MSFWRSFWCIDSAEDRAAEVRIANNSMTGFTGSPFSSSALCLRGRCRGRSAGGVRFGSKGDRRLRGGKRAECWGEIKEEATLQGLEVGALFGVSMSGGGAEATRRSSDSPFTPFRVRSG